jgi:predicted amidohydrolase YtcJ
VTARALAAGFQVGIHAIGDRGNLVALDAVEAALAAGGPRDRPADPLPHRALPGDAPAGRRAMARLGVIASMQPTHATSDMPWAATGWASERLAGAYAWRKVLDAGGRLALGSDFPVERVDPLLGLHAAVTRQDLAGEPPAAGCPGSGSTARRLCAASPSTPPTRSSSTREVGSLAVGKRADLVVFDRDPMTGPRREIPACRST